MTVMTAPPDLAAIKQRQQATWASGDYHMIGTQILIVSELMIEALDVHSTERVLDVATGSGNAALAAARRGCEVVGVDYVPALLERARRRTEAEGLTIEFVEGDAEALPFSDGSFDVVSTVFGAMFAPDQDQTANELARVTRRAAGSGSSRIRPRGSSASCSRRSDATCHRPWGSALADPLGDGGATTRSSSATRSPSCAPRSATTVPRALAGGVRRLLAPLLRPDAQGLRCRGRRRSGSLLEADIARPDRPAQPCGRRHDGRAERVSRSRDRHAIAARGTRARGSARVPLLTPTAHRRDHRTGSVAGSVSGTGWSRRGPGCRSTGPLRRRTRRRPSSRPRSPSIRKRTCVRCAPRPSNGSPMVFGPRIIGGPPADSVAWGRERRG